MTCIAAGAAALACVRGGLRGYTLKVVRLFRGLMAPVKILQSLSMSCKRSEVATIVRIAEADLRHCQRRIICRSSHLMHACTSKL